MVSNEIHLAYKNGAIGELLEYEVERRLRLEYSKKQETDIIRCTLTNSQEAAMYEERIKNIRNEVRTEIESVLSTDIDVGYQSSEESDGVFYAIDSLLGGCHSQYAEQFRRALQMFTANLAEESAIEVAYIYDEWVAGKAYTTDIGYIRYGVNSVGDPQLYKIAQDHTSQTEWTPNTTPALYTAIGLDDNGYPVWSQPSGAHDAYNEGDVVNYNGVLYKSRFDGNVYSPDEYPDGWEIYVED